MFLFQHLVTFVHYMLTRTFTANFFQNPYYGNCSMDPIWIFVGNIMKSNFHNMDILWI
jgi:hypothetical protein